MLDKAQTVASDFKCETCEEFRSSPSDGLRLLLDECSEELCKRNPTDIEFSRAQEIKTGRPMVPMVKIPSCILSMRGLRCLDFTGHPVEALPPEIGELTSLTRLVVVSSNLTALPEELCKLLHLEQLVVSCCPIRRLPEDLCNLVRLWDFYFDGNQLVEMPQKFPPLLNGIKVSGNLLKQLPDAVGTCRDVKSVRAYANQLSSLPESICNLSYATEMSLQGNRLEYLPAALGSLQQLQYLSLHDNNLRALPASVVQLQELQWLYLYNNKLQDLPKGIGRLRRLERLLVEANPLSKATLADLATGPPLRLLGLDAAQAARHPAPPWASVGWMMPWGKLYAKLQPASQLKRKAGVEPIQGAQPPEHNDVLVVSFAASQAEPEWLGVLSQVHAGQISIAEAEAQISMENVGTFSSLFRTLHGEKSLENDSEHLASTAWLLAPPYNSRSNGEVLGDFDVLSLCDTAAQWYADATEREQLKLESKLQKFVKDYRRVVFLGVSMGGFAALSNSHLASSVLVFGPQTDLTISHLRPGFDPEHLSRMYENLRKNVRAAVSSGVHFQYHVGIEEHLAYARRLPLPRSSIFIHPIEGRIARLLERVGILWPLLVRTLAQEQRIARGAVAAADSLPKDPAPEGDYAWDLNDTEENLVLGMWGRGGKLTTCRIAAKQLCRLCCFPPRAHDWFCSGCLAHNVSKANQCRSCGDQSAPVATVAESWRPNNGRSGQNCLAVRQNHGPLATMTKVIRRFAVRGLAIVAVLALFAQFLRRRSRGLKL